MPQLFGLGTHGRQFCELLLEDVVRMGAFVRVEFRRTVFVNKLGAGGMAQE